MLDNVVVAVAGGGGVEQDVTCLTGELVWSEQETFVLFFYELLQMFQLPNRFFVFLCKLLPFLCFRALHRGGGARLARTL